MRIQDGFVLTELGDRTVVTAPGKLNGVIQLNQSGTFLWNLLVQGCSEEKLACCLKERYGLDEESAQQDTAEYLEMLRKWGALEE